MSRVVTLAIVSDIHYFSAAEQARGFDYEVRGIANPFLRLFLKTYRHHLWLRHPLDHNRVLERFLKQAGPADYVIANGDYSCDSGFIGVCDDAACQSAKECLDHLREKSGAGLRAVIGDHELGKLSFVGGQGGMRLASYQRAVTDLALEPLWQVECGRYLLLGVTSSLIAFPAFAPDALPAERSGWEELRAGHLDKIRRVFTELKPEQRVLLFCHDPTALPFLWREDAVRNRLPQIEHTVIGHLHSNLILWKSRLLAGMPRIRFLGHSAKRLSSALREARLWKPFRVRLCPALSGIELLNDGGYFTMRLDPDGKQPAQFEWHPLPR
jgi:calcineurin-like phosphoesterase family protein